VTRPTQLAAFAAIRVKRRVLLNLWEVADTGVTRGDVDARRGGAKATRSRYWARWVREVDALGDIPFEKRYGENKVVPYVPHVGAKDRLGELLDELTLQERELRRTVLRNNEASCSCGGRLRWFEEDEELRQWWGRRRVASLLRQAKEVAEKYGVEGAAE